MSCRHSSHSKSYIDNVGRLLAVQTEHAVVGEAGEAKTPATNGGLDVRLQRRQQLESKVASQRGHDVIIGSSEEGVPLFDAGNKATRA